MSFPFFLNLIKIIYLTNYFTEQTHIHLIISQIPDSSILFTHCMVIDIQNSKINFSQIETTFLNYVNKCVCVMVNTLQITISNYDTL